MSEPQAPAAPAAAEAVEVRCVEWALCHLKTCCHRKAHAHMGTLCFMECRELYNRGEGPIVKDCVLV